MADAIANIRGEDKGSETCRWNLTQAFPNGEWWKSCGKSDKTFHIFGVLDGATIRFAGSSDERCITDPINAASAKIRNADGAAFSIAVLNDDKNLDLILANPVYLRPYAENPGANTNITVVVTGNTVL